MKGRSLIMYRLEEISRLVKVPVAEGKKKTFAMVGQGPIFAAITLTLVEHGLISNEIVWTHSVLVEFQDKEYYNEYEGSSESGLGLTNNTLVICVCQRGVTKDWVCYAAMASTETANVFVAYSFDAKEVLMGVSSFRDIHRKFIKQLPALESLVKDVISQFKPLDL